MPNQVWQCKYCKKVHSNKKDAEACESIHSGVKEIKEYNFKVEHNDKYPISIKCLMEDGKTIEYYRKPNIK